MKPSSHIQMEKLNPALRRNGQRVTNQRIAVFEKLHELGNHPTAEKVFLSVREILPHISLATVYKSLEVLCVCGLAQKLCSPPGSARYDHNIIEHGHLYCTQCRRVMDMPSGKNKKILKQIGTISKFTVDKLMIFAIGTCSQCRKKQKNNSE